MTIEEIKRRVKEIKQLSEDNEYAHIKEDRLWENVLQAIADKSENPHELAKEALETSKISFTRWYE